MANESHPAAAPLFLKHFSTRLVSLLMDERIETGESNNNLTAHILGARL
jgi:hypothetical protein